MNGKLFLAVGVASVLVCSAALAADALPTKGGVQLARPPVPAPDCKTQVGFDRDMELPGYLLPTKAGPKTCIPFTTPRFRPPADYQGDYYVNEFSDAKLRENWAACKADPTCHARVYDQVMKRHPPNREYGLKDAHGRFLLGKLEEKGDQTDLRTVRRPAFFARAPYREPIAAVDGQTHVVEFTAPAEPYERIHKGMTADIRLRGWYIRGAGIDDGKGGRVRALVIASGGGGDRVVAIDHPDDKAYSIDPKTGKTIPNDDLPNATTGQKGQAAWRQAWLKLHEAGFDVLALDRRGIGLSGGFSDTNTLQQGRDLLKIVADLRTGAGMRVLTADGKLVRGREAATALRGPATDLPVFFLGSSRGTMAAGWAMTLNYDKDCTYDMPEISCRPAVGDTSVKGAMLFAEYSSGTGYVPMETSPKDDGRGPGRDRGYFIGGAQVENNIIFFPSSAILAGMSKWPSVFLARGLWCYADALEGSVDSYSRVKGLKELIVVRGPHGYETWPAEEKVRSQERMIAYGQSVVLGRDAIPGGRPWSDMKELVATSSDVWEPSTQPATATGR